MGKGQTVTFTQETDAGKKSKHSINDGRTNYDVDANNLQALPENLRQFARQMIDNAKRAPAAIPAAGVAERTAVQDSTTSTEESLRRLEQQNRELLRQIEELRQLLSQQGITSRPAASPEPGP